MKTIRFLGIVVMAAFLNASFVACGGDDDEAPYTPNVPSPSPEEEITYNELSCDTVVDGLAYNILSLDDLTVEVVAKTSPNSYKGAITVPSSITFNGKSFSVTSIGKYAFRESSVTSVTIPTLIITISQSAFSYCDSLTSFTIPSSVTEISDYAFDGCDSLDSIIIPSSVNKLGEHCFSCSGLKKVTIEDSNRTLVIRKSDSEICESAFFGPIETFYIGRNILRFNSVFVGTETSDISIPYVGSKVKHITFGANVTSVEKIFRWDVFENLASITFKGTTPPKGSNKFTNNCLMNTVLYVPASAIDTYKADENWGRFWHIEAEK